MRRIAGLLGVTALLLTGAGAGHAADLPLVRKAPPLPPPPSYSWAGLYGGLNIGAVKDIGQLSDSLALEPVFFTDTAGGFTGVPGTIFLIPGTFPVAVPVSRSSNLGVLGGGQLGYNWQLAHWIYGVEADFQGTNASETFAGTFSQTFAGVAAGTAVTRSLSATWTADREWQASLRGRIGSSWDRWMVYGTAGLAITNVNLRSTYTAVTTLSPGLTPIGVQANGTTSAADNHTLLGATFGGGFEYAVTDKITVGGEYRFTHYSEKNFNGGATPATSLFTPTPPGPLTLNLNTHEIVARVNYFFGRP
jgi:outer membrane immunogenic protein